MKKMSLILAASALVAVSASAQKNSPYYTEKWSDNIFLSIGGGAQTGLGSNPNPFGEIRNHSYPNGFWRQVDPQVQVALGKYINPLWSFRLAGSGYRATSFLSSERAIQEYFNVGLDGIFNLTNAFLGYNPNKVVEFSVFGGPLANFTINQAPGPNGGLDGWRPGVNAGMQLKFNFNKYLSLDIEGRLAAISREIAHKGHDSWYAAANAGLSYTFGGKSFENCSNKLALSLAEQEALNNQINANKRQIADLQNQLAEARRVQPVAPVAPAAVAQDCNPTAGPIAVWFKIGTSTLDAQAKATINLVSRAIKADPNGVYSIIGYTDKGTGSRSLNERLSARRAQVVYDAFIAAGVDRAQLANDGGVYDGTEFPTDPLNRVTIVKRK